MSQMVQAPLSERDVDLFKGAFQGDETFAKTVKALLLGQTITQPEKDRIRTTFASAEMRDATRRKIFGKMSDDSPVGSVPDFWLNVDASQIIGAGKDAIYQVVMSKQMLYEMFQKAMALLENPDGERVNTDYNPKMLLNDELQVGLLARNLYVQAITFAIYAIYMAANQKPPETPGGLAKKAMKNSSK